MLDTLFSPFPVALEVNKDDTLGSAKALSRPRTKAVQQSERH